MELENSKLITLLKSFNKQEFKKFEDYILSPFFNTSQQITALFEIIKEKYPHFQNLDKKYIYKKIYPRSSYNDKKVRDLFSRLLKLTEEFLAQIEFSKKNVQAKRYTMRQLAARNLEKHFMNSVKEAELQLSKEIISAAYFYNQYSISKEKRSYLEILETLGKRTSFFEGITKEIDFFVVYSIYNILKYGLILQTHEKILKHNYDFKMLDQVLTYLKMNPLKDYPVIMILYYIYILNKEEADETMYFKVKELIDENLHLLEEGDQRMIIVFLLNYTKVQLIKGNNIFRNENYTILKHSIEIGLYPKEGKFFAESSYITIVGTALQEKDFKWAEVFMDVYKDELPPDQKENAYNYCKSALNYRKGNYKQALEGLATVSLDDFYYHIRVKNHEIKIFFELGDYEKVLFTIDSFRHFLGSNQHVPDYIKTRFLNYINYTGRLAYTLLTDNPKEKLQQIRQEVKDHSPEIENKTWLLEQLERVNSLKA